MARLYHPHPHRRHLCSSSPCFPPCFLLLPFVLRSFSSSPSSPPSHFPCLLTMFPSPTRGSCRARGGGGGTAVGPSRHRAWVVVQRPLRCSLGSREKPFGGLPEAVWRPLGGCFGASFGPLGGLLGPLGGLSGPLGAFLGRRRALLARLTHMEAALGASLGRLGALLERFTAVLGPSWEPLGRSVGPLGPT